jgi:UDP-N-acetyl-D-galactosamine dehydrogenase
LHEYGITPVDQPTKATYDAIVVAVAHRQFRELGADAIRAFGTSGHVLYDMKYLFPVEASDLRL